MIKSVEEVRSEIPFLKTGINYLDNAATTPTPKPVINAMLEYFNEYSANIGRGLHSSAKRASDEFEKSRDKISKTIGAKPYEIAYTKNTTEALNIVANGLDLYKGDKIVTTILEHHSNLIPWQRLKKSREIQLEVVKDTPDCVVNPQTIEDAIDKDTKLVTMSCVSNAIGTVQPFEEVGKITSENDVLFMVDAAQAVGHMPINVEDIKCDFLAAAGHKGLMGPQGTGFLFVREDRQDEIKPLLTGGGIVNAVSEKEHELVTPPQLFDAGTPNIPGIIGLGRAAEYILEIGLENIEKREKKLAREMLKINKYDEVDVYGSKDIKDKCGVVSFNLRGLNHHEVSSLLDEIGNIATRSGHHCASPIMNYLGIEGTVRASTHYYNKRDEVHRLIETIREIIQEFT